MTTITGERDVEAAIVAKLRTLPPGRRQEVLDFVEALARRNGPALDTNHSDGDDEIQVLWRPGVVSCLPVLPLARVAARHRTTHGGRARRRVMMYAVRLRTVPALRRLAVLAA